MVRIAVKFDRKPAILCTLHDKIDEIATGGNLGAKPISDGD